MKSFIIIYAIMKKLHKQALVLVHDLLKDDIHYYVVCPSTEGQLWKTVFSVAMKGNF